MIYSALDKKIFRKYFTITAKMGPWYILDGSSRVEAFMMSFLIAQAISQAAISQPATSHIVAQVWIPPYGQMSQPSLNTPPGQWADPAQTEQLQSPPSSSESNGGAGHDLWLMNGDTQVLTGQFYANESIFGVCDVDCNDLDINLYDTSGALISSDTLTDNVPIVIAPYEGIFNVEVIMTSCTHSSGCAAQVDSDYGF
jgi:hypothetical protein